MNTIRLKRTIIPLVVVLLFLLINYFGNQWYAETYGNVGIDYSYIFKDFNDKVPFISWHIYPYIIAYPFWFFSFLYIGYRSKKNMYIISTIAIITFTICGIWYFIWQSDVESWRLTSGLFVNNNYLTPRNDLNFTESIVMWIYQSAGPRNALPSMHTLTSWICIIGVRLDKKMPKPAKIIIVFLALAIIIATQTLKQHYIIDLIAGIILGEAFFWLLKDSVIVVKVGNFFDKLNYKTGLIKKETEINN
ncbi:MAG: phosphatase PAP2 family protein [Candidatus Izimaplasma sp.]|nr:phosphatase PAP2 family protein [Candidatus Izimaplasma bacterium]